MWLALAGLVVFLVIWLLRNRALLGGVSDQQIRQRALPAAVMGLDIRPESLPSNITAEALKLLKRGEQRAALGLLYRASLSVLVLRYRLQVTGSATEGECLELAREVLDQPAMQYQDALTQAWCFLAYAHDQPSQQSLEQLCHAWERIYGQ